MNTHGNTDILKLPLAAFLCSRVAPAAAVLRCYDWALAQREAGVCVLSGFHSPLEQDVLHFLLKGRQPLALMLAHGLKSKWPAELQKPLAEGRLLILSPFPESTKRASEETAAFRNRKMIDMAASITVGYSSPGGRLESLLSQCSRLFERL